MGKWADVQTCHVVTKFGLVQMNILGHHGPTGGLLSALADSYLTDLLLVSFL